MATSPSADTEVAEFAGQLFFRLWRASHTRIAEALEAIGLTPALFSVLNVIAAREGAIQQEIGQGLPRPRASSKSRSAAGRRADQPSLRDDHAAVRVPAQHDGRLGLGDRLPDCLGIGVEIAETVPVSPQRIVANATGSGAVGASGSPNDQVRRPRGRGG
jgi:hypothetical protein